MWQISKDNQVKGTADELRTLKPRTLKDRTLFIECPQFPVMDAKTAHFIAKGYLSNAVIGQCDKIVVRGKVWHYDFNTLDLNNRARMAWGNRSIMVQNPIEMQIAGNFFDETRQLWAVPGCYNVRETIKFPASSQHS